MLPYLFLKGKSLIKKTGAMGETGQTLVEYVLVLAIIAVVTVALLVYLGVTLGDSYETIAFTFPNINLFEQPLSIGHTSNDQGYIQWFLIDN